MADVFDDPWALDDHQRRTMQYLFQDGLPENEATRRREIRMNLQYFLNAIKNGLPISASHSGREIVRLIGVAPGLPDATGKSLSEIALHSFDVVNDVVRDHAAEGEAQASPSDDTLTESPNEYTQSEDKS